MAAATSSRRLEAALDQLAQSAHWPGGVAGVVHHGEVIAARAWGLRDVNRRLPMQPTTLLPICSLSKQFTCRVLLSEVADPSVLDRRLADYLPLYQDPLPTVQQLCDMQSGLRDYWALSVLQGYAPDSHFDQRAGLDLIALMQRGHFASGTQYSYSNTNFRLLPELLRDHTGKAPAELYARLLEQAGMQTATFDGEIARATAGVVGYEGNTASGYFPADNRLSLFGDAGINASLEDMLAWECFIDQSQQNGDELTLRLSRQSRFANGDLAPYGFGLRRETIAGKEALGHGGALRGFRAFRMNIAAERLSVVVMFNHEADARAAAVTLAETVLDYTPQSRPLARSVAEFQGEWLDSENSLAFRVDLAQSGRALLHYGHMPQEVWDNTSGLHCHDVLITKQGDHLLMHRESDSTKVAVSLLAPSSLSGVNDLVGTYYSAEMNGWLTIQEVGGAASCSFSGKGGHGPAERLQSFGEDVWLIINRRALDAPAPGEWTLRASRGANGAVTSLTLGCWLARQVTYQSVETGRN